MLASCAALTAAPQRQNTTRRGLKAIPRNVAAALATKADTIADAEGKVVFSGYEKTLRSTRETLFATNRTDSTVTELRFTIVYHDAQGRQLHSARKRVATEIPAHETRRLDFPSWDKQCTFYYTGSPRPRVSAIPYTVTIKADTVLLIQP